jgi:hypothetical protein
VTSLQLVHPESFQIAIAEVIGEALKTVPVPLDRIGSRIRPALSVNR